MAVKVFQVSQLEVDITGSKEGPEVHHYNPQKAKINYNVNYVK